MIDAELFGDAEEAGLFPEKVDQLLSRVQREVDEGLLNSTQVALAKDGKLLLLANFGEARDDSLFCVFSATKGITSAAAWILMQEGKLKEDEIVADIIPEFGTNGKDVITVQQLFTHTAGFPHAPFKPLEWNDKARRLERYSQWTLNWPPGSRFEYHPTASMWIIAELIERRTNQSFQSFVSERIAQPLGLRDLFVGLPESEQHRAMPCEHNGDPMTAEDWGRLGMPVPPVTEVTEDAIERFNLPEVQAVGVPGGGGFMSAAELAMFYQALLHGGLNGTQLWDEATLARGRTVLTGDTTELMLGHLVNRTLGLIVSGDEQRNFRGFGKTNSPLAFGHNGAGGQIAWADPATGLSLGYCTNTHDRNNVRQGRRGVAISSIAAECAPLL
jgi:CubicO group peptidase (beta-lactamase class C family)